MNNKVIDSTATGEVQFIQNHQISLETGRYQIEIKQKVKIGRAEDDFSSNLTFVVQGDRFTLSPRDIHAVFPPAGSLGDHCHILPHIALNRSTLPWERLVRQGSPQDVPWLALILIHEGEMAESGNRAKADSAQTGNVETVTLGELQKPSTNAIKWPGVTLETGQQKEDKVSVIDIPKKLLLEILPDTRDSSYLAHVRQVVGGAQDGDPLAVVISNRLPKKDKSSTAYLVSLENRYKNDTDFDYQNATPEDRIRLVVLESWSFACAKPKENFVGLLKKLSKGTLKLPKQNNSEAAPYFTEGYTASSHYLRQGGKTFSWYHSPLTPGKNRTKLSLAQLPVRSADQLTAYSYNTGLFDVSYAAAWQLGQLLALQDKQFAISLFNWKRANAQKLAQANQQALSPHLFPDRVSHRDSSTAKNDLPQDIKTWFEQLGLLSSVPFNYLVPDEQMLPLESIRFFCLDWFWVDSLLDGAFSIGRVQNSDVEQDSHNNPLSGEAKQISGFLMRSEVVSGWPDLQIDGSESAIDEDSPMTKDEKLNVLRRDRISEDVLICLFDGEVKTADISLKPEGLHFGFNIDEKKSDETGKLLRELRQLDGTERSDWKVQPIPWRLNKNQKENQKVVDISHLADEIKQVLEANPDDVNVEDITPFTSAQFTLQMIQGAEKVRLSIAE